MAFKLFQKKKHYYLCFVYKSVKYCFMDREDLKENGIKGLADLKKKALEESLSLFEYVSYMFDDVEWKLTELVEMKVCEKTSPKIQDQDWTGCQTYRQDDLIYVNTEIDQPIADGISVYQNILPQTDYYEYTTYKNSIKGCNLGIPLSKCGMIFPNCPYDDDGEIEQIKQYNTIECEEAVLYDGSCKAYWDGKLIDLIH